MRAGNLSAAEEFPDVILAASVDQDLRIASTYRGQDISWRAEVLWGQLDRLGWLEWLVFRAAPIFHEQVILWARADLFLASEELAQDLFPLDSAAEENPADDDFIPLEDIEELRPE